MNNLNKRHVILTITAIIFLVVVTGIAVEIILHLAAYLSPRVATTLFPANSELTVPDFELITKGNPRYPEHDENGFRNAYIPNKVDIVTIGDSQTYGEGVDFKEAWPRVLEKLTSCRVYNMSLGGYGPLQYVTLAQQALRFKPRLILIGIYFGNDLFDTWPMYLRHPMRYPLPHSLLRPALELERTAPLSSVTQFFLMGHATDPRPTNSAWPFRYFLSQNSSLWALGRAIKNRLFPAQKNVLSHNFQTAVAALTPEQLEYASIFEGVDWRTIFTSRYREAVENDDDPRIRAGYWLTEWAVQHIHQLAKRNGIKSTFILLPTKESVFESKVKDAKEYKYYEKLTADENLHRQHLIEFMQKHNISYIDMGPPLRSSMRQPYFENADGHPNEIGHEIIATRLLKDTGVCE